MLEAGVMVGGCGCAGWMREGSHHLLGQPVVLPSCLLTNLTNLLTNLLPNYLTYLLTYISSYHHLIGQPVHDRR